MKYKRRSQRLAGGAETKCYSNSFDVSEVVYSRYWWSLLYGSRPFLYVLQNYSKMKLIW